MTVTIQWDDDAPLAGQPDAGTDTKVYTEAGPATVTITDEAIGGESRTLNFVVPLSLTTVEPVPDEVDSNGDVAERTVTIAGQGFPANTTGTVAIATGVPGAYGTTVAATAATTNASGIFTGASVVVPADTDAGDYHIEATFGAIADLEAALTIVNTELVAPTGLASPSQTASTVNLTWAAVVGAEEYVVRWSPAGTEEWTEEDPVAVTNAVVGGLAAETEYDFEVKATAAGSSDSAWSDTFTQETTAQPQLDAPENVAAGTTTVDTIPLTWDAVTDADTYTVGWRETPAGEWTEESAIATTSYDIEDLDPLTEYEFRVKAVASGYEDSEWSATDTAVTQPIGILDTPQNLTSPAQSDETVDLEWDAVDDATGYTVEWSIAGAGDWEAGGTPATNEATVTDLSADTEYDFRVAATAAGWTDSDWSSVLTESTTV